MTWPHQFFFKGLAWKRVVAVFIISFTVIYLSNHFSLLSPLERLEQDFWHRLAGVRHVPQHVALAIIDENTLNTYRDDPLVFWSPHYATVSRTLRKVGAKVVGLDLLLSISPEEWLHKNDIAGGSIAGTYDVPLRTEIAQGQLILAAASATDSSGKSAIMLPASGYLLAVPEFDLISHIGLADLVADEDGGVRNFTIAPPLKLSAEQEGMPTLSLAGLLAMRATGQDTHASSWKFDGLSYSANDTAKPIGYSGPPGTIPRIPLSLLLSPDAVRLPEVQALKDKVVIIGGEYQGMNDVHVTPYTTSFFGAGGSYMTGPEIQANIVETLLAGYLPQQTPNTALYGLWVVVLGIAAFLFQQLRPLMGLGLLPILWLTCGWFAYLAFSGNLILPIADLQFGLAVAFLASLGFKWSTEERERKRVTGIFGRYVSEGVVEQILASGSAPRLGGESRTMTVLFSDIRNFTVISEKLEAHEVVEMLNTYFERICPIVLNEGGTIDKFIGDAIMVQFGAPLAYEDHADRAIRSALAMKQEAASFQTWLQERFPERDLPLFGIGIGLHSGQAVVGNIGSQSRLEYTAIGDVVNAASRIESKTKEFGAPLVASRQTIEAAKGKVLTGKTETVSVKGKQVQLELHEILGIEEQTV